MKEAKEVHVHITNLVGTINVYSEGGIETMKSSVVQSLTEVIRQFGSQVDPQEDNVSSLSRVREI